LLAAVRFFTMTLGDSLLVLGARATQDVHSVQVRITASGKSFRALAAKEAAIDPSMPLGSDLREMRSLSVVRADLAGLGLLDATTAGQIAVTIDGIAYTITKREDDAIGPFVDFDVVKV